MIVCEIKGVRMMLAKRLTTKIVITLIALILLFLAGFLIFTGFDLGISNATTYSGATLV